MGLQQGIRVKVGFAQTHPGTVETFETGPPVIRVAALRAEYIFSSRLLWAYCLLEELLSRGTCSCMCSQ